MVDEDREHTRKPRQKADPKRSRMRAPKRSRLLRQLNRTRIPISNWSAFLSILGDIPTETRDLKSLVITAGEVFDNFGEALAAIIRYQAIFRLLEQETLTGWYRRADDQDNEVWEVRGQIMQAAATVPINTDDKQRPCFDKDELLKEAFKIGKR